MTMQEKYTLTRVLGTHKENGGIDMHVGVGSIAGTQKGHHTLKKFDLYSVLRRDCSNYWQMFKNI